MKDSTFIILLAAAIGVAGVLVYMARKKKESSANKKEQNTKVGVLEEPEAEEQPEDPLLDRHAHRMTDAMLKDLELRALQVKIQAAEEQARDSQKGSSRDAEIAERIQKQFLERFHGKLSSYQRAFMEQVIAEEQEKARQQAALSGADGKLRTLK